MRLSSPRRPVERARPLLGTIVAIRVCDLASAEAHRAIDAAFAEIAATHRAMSFHLPDSDVSRLNREAYCRPVMVNPHTQIVLRLARCFADATDGAFDITTAAQLVALGVLPAPRSLLRPDPCASWRDIELRLDGSVRFSRPLWVDLGGIAKGYAVDRAIACLARHGVRRCLVNAGGDLRVVGPLPERIRLRTGVAPAAVVELTDGSLASSGGFGETAGLVCHVNGRTRGPSKAGAFASVVAESCAVADALTKPVLALGERCAAILRRFRATAYLLTADGDWRQFGAFA